MCSNHTAPTNTIRALSKIQIAKIQRASTQTYLLAGEVFPTAIRGKGAGFAAAFAKIGAVATAFLFPILLASIGTRWLLYSLIVSSLLGALVTWMFRIETTGINLDHIGEAIAEPKTAKATT